MIKSNCAVKKITSIKIFFVRGTVMILKCSQNGIILPFQKFEYDTSWIIEEINYNPCNESKRLYIYCKQRNASGLLITCYDYIGVEKFAARWSATKCEISTLNSPSCCHQLVQQLIIIGQRQQLIKCAGIWFLYKLHFLSNMKILLQQPEASWELFEAHHLILNFDQRQL